MKKYKVLFVVSEFFKGGAERFTYEIDRVLDKSKFEVTILCLNGKNAKNSTWHRHYHKLHLALGTKILYNDEFLNPQNAIINKLRKKLRIKSKEIINYKLLVNYLSKFDLIHWMGEYTFYKKLPNFLIKKSLINIMSAKFQNQNLYKNFDKKKKYNFISGFTEKEAIYELNEFPQKKHWHFPLIFKIEENKIWNFKNTVIKKIGIFTRLDKYKPLDPFFYAFQLLLTENKNIELHIFGSGDPEEQGLNLKLKNLDILDKVFFRGHQENITKTAIIEDLNLSWFQGYNNNRPAGYAGFDICSVGIPLICWDFYYKKIEKINEVYPHFKNLRYFVDYTIKILTIKEEAIKLSNNQIKDVMCNRDSSTKIKQLEAIYHEIIN
ncbi:hypothetical protein [uncultured Polaribacter sp.]|uniref:hypothetical protein n=1 Tax=uncultured Polaribacter sp. TaxID=174711 RepID=UPI002629CE4B|nr:hypothetical protein [uncultured Polaribacter sp.]